MKQRIAVILIVVSLMLVAYAPGSHAWSRHHHQHRSNAGLYVAGALAGGLILGTVIGTAVSQPRYVYPAPAATYPSAAPGEGYYAEEPPGEWVSVPGRWVRGRWVPAHRVWIPVNPY
jgi:hypothetical protein